MKPTTIFIGYGIFSVFFIAIWFVSLFYSIIADQSLISKVVWAFEIWVLITILIFILATKSKGDGSV